MRVLLLEREPLLATQASGQNAAVYRPLEEDVASGALAARSCQLLCELVGPEVLQRVGLLLVSADSARVAALSGIAAHSQVAHEVLDGSALAERVPQLRAGQCRAGLWLTDGGVLDIHLLTSRLAKLARARGAQLQTLSSVSEIELALDEHAQRARGVRLASGEVLTAEHVILAAGAWNGDLAARAGVPLPLTPRRRHLVQLRATAAPDPHSPVVWRLEDEVYFRAESGGILASPCDETTWSAALALSTDPSALVSLAQKLERMAPALADSQVQRAWACLRTFAPDHEPVVGEDPRVHGLHWIAGLGGRGMSAGIALAEILTRGIVSPLPAAGVAAIRVDRLL